MRISHSHKLAPAKPKALTMSKSDKACYYLTQKMKAYKSSVLCTTKEYYVMQNVARQVNVAIRTRKEGSKIRVFKWGKRGGDFSKKVAAVAIVAALLVSTVSIAHSYAQSSFPSYEGQQYDISKDAIVAARVKAMQGTYELPPLPDMALSTVNEYVNGHFKYKAEAVDKWKTPTEFEQDGYGDCDDFAVMKYHYLKNSGHTVEIAVGILKDSRIPHSVVVVDNKWVLDNRYNTVRHWSSFKKNFRTTAFYTENSVILSDE